MIVQKLTIVFGYVCKQVSCQKLSKSPNLVTLVVKVFKLIKR